MKYRVESIGAAFDDKGIVKLSKHLTMQSASGWELHTVFAVEKKGCLGQTEGQTYLAVYTQHDD